MSSEESTFETCSSENFAWEKFSGREKHGLCRSWQGTPGTCQLYSILCPHRAALQCLYNDLQTKKKVLFQSFNQQTCFECFLICARTSARPWGYKNEEAFIAHHSSLTSQATCFVVSFPLQDSPRCSFYSARVKPGLTVLNLVWLFNLWWGDEGSLWREKCSEHQMGLSDMEHRCYKLQKRQPIFFLFFCPHTWKVRRKIMRSVLCWNSILTSGSVRADVLYLEVLSGKSNLGCHLSGHS